MNRLLYKPHMGSPALAPFWSLAPTVPKGRPMLKSYEQ